MDLPYSQRMDAIRKLKELEAIGDSHRAALEHQKAVFEEYTRELENYRRLVTSEEAGIEALEAKLARAKESLEDPRAPGVQAHVRSIEGSISTLKEQLARSQAKVRDYEAFRDRVAADIEATEARIMSTDREVRELRLLLHQ